MTEYVMFLVLYACVAGAGAGFLAGLFGIGGGVIVVPALYGVLRSLEVSPDIAIGIAVASSLCCILPTSIASVRAHRRLGNLDWPQLRSWLPALFLGSVVGSLLVSYAAGGWVNWVFASLLLVVAALTAMTAVGRWPPASLHAASLPAWVRPLLVWLVALCSAMAGIGGGALGAPLLMTLGFPVHRAIGTAAGFGFAIAAPAVVVLLLAPAPERAPLGMVGLVNLPAVIAIASCSVLMAPIGARVGKRMSHTTLSRLLSLLLLLLSVKMFVTAA